MTAVLGAGIAGLSAAYYALKTPKVSSLVILEATNRVGGWIRSIKQSDGTLLEYGPRVMRVYLKSESSLNSLTLAAELGLSSKLIAIKSNDPTLTGYIFADNALHHMNNNLKGIVTKNTLLNRSLLSVFWNDLKAAKVLKDDESVYNFIERRFGKDVSEKLAAPGFCGIFGGDIRELSAKSCMTSLFEAEQKHGSVIMGLMKEGYLNNKNNKQNKLQSRTNQTKDISESIIQRAKEEKWRRWALRGGLEQLPQVLADNITKNGANIKMNHSCEQIVFDKNSVELTVNGKVEKYSHIISSLSAKSLANLVEKQHPELSKELLGIPTVTIAMVHLRYSKNVLSLSSAGVLVAPKEEIPILGVTFDSCTIPENSTMTVLTVMMGGAWFEKYFGKCSSEDHLKTVAIKYTNEILSIQEDPKACHVSILKDCIPQYLVGHEQRLTRIHDYISAHKIPLRLCGSSYHGISVADVILSAKLAASNINQNT